VAKRKVLFLPLPLIEPRSSSRCTELSRLPREPEVSSQNTTGDGKMKVYLGSGGIVPRILNLGTRWR
jgi:hypothetical protein